MMRIIKRRTIRKFMRRRAKYKKKIAQEKIKWKKSFIPINPKNIHAMA